MRIRAAFGVYSTFYVPFQIIILIDNLRCKSETRTKYFGCIKCVSAAHFDDFEGVRMTRR